MDINIFVENYKQFYSNELKEERNRLDISGFKPINSYIEEWFTNDVLNSNEKYLKWQYFAWKSGRLIYSENKSYMVEKYNSDSWNGCNVYGKSIPIDNLNCLITDVNKYMESIEEISNVKELFSFLANKKKEYKVDNIGAVYILFMIFCISKMEYPIYDRFVHKAAKAILFDANPQDICMDSLPGLGYDGDKLKEKSLCDIFKYYNEYCWLLKQIFGSYTIDRDKDRALWVYGHCSQKCEKIDGIDHISYEIYF